MTICSACHHVIKRVNDDMKNVEDIRTRANNYMQLEAPYEGETTVLHYLEVLRDRVGFDKLKEKVVNPLTGKKIGAYYGCLLLRPGKIMAFDDPENPRIMEDFIRALGAEPVIYPYRNECCGGYISLKEKEMSQNMCEKIEESAAGFGADMLITACPLCKYNLNKNSGNKMPVYYFTELLAEALGVKEEVAKREKTILLRIKYRRSVVLADRLTIHLHSQFLLLVKILFLIVLLHFPDQRHHIICDQKACFFFQNL